MDYSWAESFISWDHFNALLTKSSFILDKLCIYQLNCFPCLKYQELKVQDMSMQEFKIHTCIHDHCIIICKQPYLLLHHHVEAERGFSAAGLFSTKFHSHLSEHSLNMVCFFRSYFLNKKGEI